MILALIFLGTLPLGYNKINVQLGGFCLAIGLSVLLGITDLEEDKAFMALYVLISKYELDPNWDNVFPEEDLVKPITSTKEIMNVLKKGFEDWEKENNPLC